MVDKGLHVLVERTGVEDCGTDVDNVGKVLVEDSRVADGLQGSIVHELVNLRYFHDFLLSF